jgi:3-oxoacyl-(acyl-carrier-protein) synthase
MNDGFIPPTLHFTEPRPGCTFDFVPNVARLKEYHAFISANYAFGGNNAAIVVTKWDHVTKPPVIGANRVVITGTGMVTSLGIGTKATVEALKNRSRGICGIESLQVTGMQSCCAGLINGIKSSEIDRRLDLSQLNKISLFATSAAALALQDSGLKVNRKNSEEVGLVMGVCNGPCESGHMDSVFTSETNTGDINSFSNITANSTAGWVSNLLCLKGVSMTLAPGHHAGLQALAYAYDALADNRAKAIIAGASDEVYAQTYINYNLMGFLCRGEDEINYGLKTDNLRRKVLGEGAGMLVLETSEAAKERGAPILGEVLGYGMSMDAGRFSAPNLDSTACASACRVALNRSGLPADDIDCVVWAPQGNGQDLKTLDALKSLFGSRPVPLASTVFNTGYIESASILVSIAAVLESLRGSAGLWPQLTGVTELDNRQLKAPVRHILVAGSSDVGYNFALVIGRERV